MNQNLPTGFWYLVIVDDKHRMLNAESINGMLMLIHGLENIKFVILDYIYGAGKDGLIALLQDDLEEIYKIENVLELTKNIIQLDWGDFFLFKEYPNNWSNPKGQLYPYVVAQSNTTLRAVDDRYMYVYTKNKNLVDVIKSKYEVESISLDSLEKLEFPE